MKTKKDTYPNWGRWLPCRAEILQEYERRIRCKEENLETKAEAEKMRMYVITNRMKLSYGWLARRCIEMVSPEEKEAAKAAIYVLEREGKLERVIAYLKKILFTTLMEAARYCGTSHWFADGAVVNHMKTIFPQLYQAIVSAPELFSEVYGLNVWPQEILEDWLFYNMECENFEETAISMLEKNKGYYASNKEAYTRLTDIAIQKSYVKLQEKLTQKLLDDLTQIVELHEEDKTEELLKKLCNAGQNLWKSYFGKEEYNWMTLRLENLNNLLKINDGKLSLDIREMDEILAKEKARLLNEWDTDNMKVKAFLWILKHGRITISEDRLYEVQKFLIREAYEDEVYQLYQQGFLTKNCIRELMELVKETGIVEMNLKDKMPLLLPWYYD